YVIADRHLDALVMQANDPADALRGVSRTILRHISIHIGVSPAYRDLPIDWGELAGEIKRVCPDEAEPAHRFMNRSVEAVAESFDHEFASDEHLGVLAELAGDYEGDAARRTLGTLATAAGIEGDYDHRWKPGTPDWAALVDEIKERCPERLAR